MSRALKDGQFVGTKIKDGKYRIDRVPFGECIVTVDIKKFPLPAQYSDPEKSGLKLTVKKGMNMADWELK